MYRTKLSFYQMLIRPFWPNFKFKECILNQMIIKYVSNIV